MGLLAVLSEVSVALLIGPLILLIDPIVLLPASVYSPESFGVLSRKLRFIILKAQFYSILKVLVYHTESSGVPS